MTFSFSPVIFRHSSRSLSGHRPTTTTSVPWRLASKFQSTQHRREAYLGVLRGNLAAFRAAITEGAGSPSTSEDPSLPGEVHHRKPDPGQDSRAHEDEQKGSTGILASTPMPYTFLFDASTRSSSSPLFCSPTEVDPSAQPPPLLFPSGWVEHATSQIMLATDGVLSAKDVYQHRGYFLSALVHPSYLSHTWRTIGSTQKKKLDSKTDGGMTGEWNGVGPHPAPEEWWRWLSDTKVQEAIAMPPACLRAGAAALRVVEEVSWMPLQVPLPSSSSSSSSFSGEWDETQEKKTEVPGEDWLNRSRHAALCAPPRRAPPLTGENLFSVAIHSRLASCMLWHASEFFPPRSPSASVETRRIASSSLVFMENPTRQPMHGKHAVVPTVVEAHPIPAAPPLPTSTSHTNTTHGERDEECPLPPPPPRDGTTEEIPVEVMADGVTAFCGALDLVMGTLKMAAFLDLYVTPEEEERERKK